jgi:hypothetical protein
MLYVQFIKKLGKNVFIRHKENRKANSQGIIAQHFSRNFSDTFSRKNGAYPPDEF